jgi:YD repeat-containing protein
VSITYADGESSTYAYNTDGDLISAENYDGYKVTYGYTAVTPYRVNSISESGGATAGGSVCITYGWNSTTFVDNIGRKSIYQFNNAGQTVAIRDVDGSAQYCEFNTGSRTVTQLKNVSKLQKTSINLLSNHNMEAAANWSFTSGAAYSTAYAFMGSRSIQLTSSTPTTAKYAYQTVTLTPGSTYTLSAYIRGVDGICISV